MTEVANQNFFYGILQYLIPAGQGKPNKSNKDLRMFSHSQALGGAAELSQSGFQPPRVSCGKKSFTSVLKLFLKLLLD